MTAIYYDVIWFHQYNQDWHTETFDTSEEAEARAEEIRSRGFKVEIQMFELLREKK